MPAAPGSPLGPGDPGCPGVPSGPEGPEGPAGPAQIHQSRLNDCSTRISFQNCYFKYKQNLDIFSKKRLTVDTIDTSEIMNAITDSNYCH